MLQQQFTCEDLLDSLASEYEAPRKQLQNDLEAFLHELECHDLVASRTNARSH
jgi:hypothetical protein